MMIATRAAFNFEVNKLIFAYPKVLLYLQYKMKSNVIYKGENVFS